MPKQNRAEWALAVSAADGHLTVPVLKADGQDEAVSVQVLGERGLPTVGTLRERVVDTNLSTWECASTIEYLAGFGLNLDGNNGKGHVVYVIADGRRRLLVPALALMRAFFRPNRYFLPEMFRAQALDHMCYLDTREVPYGIKVTASWAKGSKADRRTNVPAALAWLLSTPGTRELAASVHSYAMQGCLAVTLPPIIASLVPWGVEQGGTVYVTKLSLKLLRQADALGPENVGVSGRKGFNLYGKGAASQSVAGLDRKLRLLPRADDQKGLLDTEWAEVEELLGSQAGRKLTDVSFRDIGETVLAKVAHGSRIGWSVVNWREIQVPLLAYYYRKWAMDGSLEACVYRLNELRSAAVPEQ